ncbi:hypothetical protein EKD04_025615 [Chloroflexales bacterium ZM16-3]|nr:hypothetical protein [Chloroflexales bacterium ZM16-3]
MRKGMRIWRVGALRLLLVWAHDAFLRRRLLPVEVFVERRYLAAVICTGAWLHGCRFTLPVSVLPAGWRICVRYGGTPGDAWVHRHVVIPD